ncbi:hypothetical protein O181_058634, partial [Austropuccinia psidii MF-1]|nr:hypothetical protein [Austropuccinia psidii MF-1]
MDPPSSYQKTLSARLLNSEGLSTRPTLPSLRSQVGEYLPQSSTHSSKSTLQHSGFPPPYQHLGDSNSTRLSSSSSSLINNSNSPKVSLDRLQSLNNKNQNSTNFNPSNIRTTSRISISDSNSNSILESRKNSANNNIISPLTTAPRSTVSVACTNCRSAHLACSDGRPCRRCLQTGRAGTCMDVEPKKRGRPRTAHLTVVGMTTSMMQNLSTDPSKSTSSFDPNSNDLVIIMSTSLRCARVSPAVPQTLGISSKDLLEQPLSTFIHTDEKEHYAHFSLALLSYPGVSSRPVPVSATRLHQTPITELKARLPGAPVHTQNFYLHATNNTWIPFKFEAYLGSAFGAHPEDPTTLKYTYVVLNLRPLSHRQG